MEIRNKRSTTYFILYIVLLFVSATTRDFGVSPFIAHTFGTIVVAFVEPVWKAIFWIIPLFLLLVYSGKQPVLRYLKLTGHVRRGLLWGIGAGLYFFLLGIGGALIQGNHLSFQHSLNDWLNSVVLVGLVEETLFRGLLYQWIEQALASRNEEPKTVNEENEEIIKLKKQLPRQSEIWAALLSTLLFAAIHFPTWIETSTSLTIMTTTTAFNIFFGLVACALLKYSNSLWSCILAHTMNDLALLLR